MTRIANTLTTLLYAGVTVQETRIFGQAARLHKTKHWHRKKRIRNKRINQGNLLYTVEHYFESSMLRVGNLYLLTPPLYKKFQEIVKDTKKA